jgi:hypothetical protein
MYTTGRIKAADIILAPPYNEEINQSVGELNGGLDQNNLPLDSVDRDRLVPPVRTDILTSPQQVNYVMPSQDYYLAEQCLEFVDPLSGIEVAADTWLIGWQKLESLPGNDKDGFVLNFTATEGMIKGEACLDAEMRQSCYLYEVNSIPANPGDPVVSTLIENIKDTHTGEFGVFVNDLLVARTGPIWLSCGRHSYVIPYSCPIASGACHIDVRWIIDFKNEGVGFGTTVNYNFPTNFPAPDGTGLYTAPLVLRNAILWARNQKR